MQDVAGKTFEFEGSKIKICRLFKCSMSVTGATRTTQNGISTHRTSWEYHPVAEGLRGAGIGERERMRWEMQNTDRGWMDAEEKKVNLEHGWRSSFMPIASD